jgi:superfamily I DNA/RNA helicase
VYAFCENCQTKKEVIRAIEKMFVEDDTDGIRLSSVHRAKGLEADRVFILCPELMPHPMAKTDWAKAQEQNLRYVAITRAKHLLAYVVK